MTSGTLFIRFTLFFILTLVWYFNVLVMAIPLSVWYMYQFKAVELVLLGLLLDIYFLTDFTLPIYTAGFSLAILFMQILKPRLRKNEIYEMA